MSESPTNLNATTTVPSTQFPPIEFLPGKRVARLPEAVLAVEPGMRAKLLIWDGKPSPSGVHLGKVDAANLPAIPLTVDFNSAEPAVGWMDDSFERRDDGALIGWATFGNAQIFEMVCLGQLIPSIKVEILEGPPTKIVRSKLIEVSLINPERHGYKPPEVETTNQFELARRLPEPVRLRAIQHLHLRGLARAVKLWAQIRSEEGISEMEKNSAQLVVDALELAGDIESISVREPLEAKLELRAKLEAMPTLVEGPPAHVECPMCGFEARPAKQGSVVVNIRGKHGDHEVSTEHLFVFPDSWTPQMMRAWCNRVRAVAAFDHREPTEVELAQVEEESAPATPTTDKVSISREEAEAVAAERPKAPNGDPFCKCTEPQPQGDRGECWKCGYPIESLVSPKRRW